MTEKIYPLYLVTFDGWMEGYGSSVFVLGLYSSEEEAEEAIRKNEMSEFAKITELAVGDTLPVTRGLGPMEEWTTSEYLGGYCE